MLNFSFSNNFVGAIIFRIDKKKQQHAPNDVK